MEGKEKMRMILIIIILFFLGCGELPGSYSYTPTRDDLTCSEICEEHCENCWAWRSEILSCQRECVAQCKIHGCNYIDVPSSTCKKVFKDTCEGNW